jgi:hypothetical protein
MLEICVLLLPCHRLQGRNLNDNRYFCEVRYLLYICLILVPFGVSSRLKAANAVFLQSPKTYCSNYRPVFPQKAIPFSAEGKAQLHYSARPISPLKRYVGNAYLFIACLPYQQALLCSPFPNIQSREDYIPHSLLHLFPKHNFW